MDDTWSKGKMELVMLTSWHLYTDVYMGDTDGALARVVAPAHVPAVAELMPAGSN